MPVLDHEGKSPLTLLDRVEFHVSDLLDYCREHKLTMDLIVGCIPQILNPDPTAMSKLVSENASEEFLYSLSNYCGLQGRITVDSTCFGFVEDQFGLGLIARAAEEGISIIRPTGRLIFNIGGRPGQAVTERLFSRRGFHINKLWQTRVNQAGFPHLSTTPRPHLACQFPPPFATLHHCPHPSTRQTYYDTAAQVPLRYSKDRSDSAPISFVNGKA